ncbi:S-adenosylmethionine decarboxylase [Cristinia sonorae]|uniref:adenosylmethionine decarboxylase n=1 Tax=Cristinia sonorae TaxID=1940300 RepID=A0A8K0UHB0_9AGAR|nr:S-adenosylmethionine decarboxylase [Cristinia sonorae]
MSQEQDTPSGPFEGPEKLLEIWFAPSPADLPGATSATDGKLGLRKVSRQIWEDMLDIVKCKVLSVVEGSEMDAYLLSESSLFVSPHRLILKTCGTTLNLLGLPRILEIAKEYASLDSVYRCFYSRKAFMFPEKQQGPHRDWNAEVQFLDNIFPGGAAYTIGKVNGDHWLLYITSPGDELSGGTAPSSPTFPRNPPAQGEGTNGVETNGSDDIKIDYTIEILMTNLSSAARSLFDTSTSSIDVPASDPTAHAIALSSSCGISDIFPRSLTTLDAYSFSPCGYSSNALIRWRDDAGGDLTKNGEGYYTIHVTPEEGWSYASFECNVPLSAVSERKGIPDLKTLILRVVDIFQPGRLTLTLFISSEENASAEEAGESAVEAAQRAFRAALTVPRGVAENGAGSSRTSFNGLYKRTDKINYEFGGYDLAFASFELRS